MENLAEELEKSFARCAGRMMEIIGGKRKRPEQVQGNGQLSPFQFGMKMERRR